MKYLNLTLLTAALTATSAHAATFTTIQEPATEQDHSEILSFHFGGTFSASGVNFSNGNIDVTRVDDSLDQLYVAESWRAEVIGTFAAASQSFGTIDDGVAFDVIGRRFDVTGEASGNSDGQPFAFARLGDQFGTIDASTNQQDNPFGQDQVITYTYSVNGDPVENKFLLFFEDLATGDFDYNDIVVEVTIVNGGLVPEPSSLALLAIGGLAVARRRRG